MKDFKHYKIFPTHVFSFKGQGVNDKEMLEYFEKEVKKESGKKSLNWQSSPDLHKNKIFESLSKTNFDSHLLVPSNVAFSWLIYAVIF